jgi:hypothetical protein
LLTPSDELVLTLWSSLIIFDRSCLDEDIYILIFACSSILGVTLNSYFICPPWCCFQFGCVACVSLPAGLYSVRVLSLLSADVYTRRDVITDERAFIYVVARQKGETETVDIRYLLIKYVINTCKSSLCHWLIDWLIL